MVKRNLHMAKLQAGYLFPEINKRKKRLLAKNPNAQLINLGIGNTTLPLPSYIAEELQRSSIGLGNEEGYSGYGPEQGQPELRSKIAEVIYKNTVHEEEVFVSDGSKCDIGRLQVLFGSHTTIAVQDPAYPVYVDTSIVLGQTQGYNAENSSYEGIVYMRCHPDNGFFPDFESVPRTDLIYFCSPNNPTGAVANHTQLKKLVDFAKKNKSIIIFDSAYASYIRDPSLPKSIYEIDGAKEVAIEVGSFSKMAGFTGLRLAWTIIPDTLLFDDGTPVRRDWERIHTTFFNGASNVVQKGGISALEGEGKRGIEEIVDRYMENSLLILNEFNKMGIKTYGGTNAPYLWVTFGKCKSWDIFEEILEKMHIVTTPGSGFGPAGEGFLRLSAFAPRSQIHEAMERFRKTPLSFL